jgi:hypothetical protein
MDAERFEQLTDTELYELERLTVEVTPAAGRLKGRAAPTGFSS